MSGGSASGRWTKPSRTQPSQASSKTLSASGWAVAVVVEFRSHAYLADQFVYVMGSKNSATEVWGMRVSLPAGGTNLPILTVLLALPEIQRKTRAKEC